MSDAGKLLMFLGLMVALVGAVLWGAGRLGFRGLPGDVRYEGENVRFYFPVVTFLVLSILLTLGLWLWRWLGGR